MHVSYLDNSKHIDQDMWAVTMIKRPTGNHTQIIIEGVELSQQFMKVAHLTGQMICKKFTKECYYFFGNNGQVKVTPVQDPSILQYGSKTPTWLKSSEVVKHMLTEMELEKLDPKGHPTPFNIFGRRSLFSQKVEYYQTDNPDLLKIMNRCQTEFVTIYRLAQIYYQSSLLEMSLTAKKKVKEKNAAGVFSGNDEYAGQFAMMAGQFQGTILAIPELVIDHIRTARQRMSSAIVLSVLPYKKGIVRAMRFEVKKIEVPQDNCFTWAKEKLKQLDIVLKNTWLDNIVSIPKKAIKHAIHIQAAPTATISELEQKMQEASLAVELEFATSSQPQPSATFSTQDPVNFFPTHVPSASTSIAEEEIKQHVAEVEDTEEDFPISSDEPYTVETEEEIELGYVTYSKEKPKSSDSDSDKDKLASTKDDDDAEIYVFPFANEKTGTS